MQDQKLTDLVSSSGRSLRVIAAARGVGKVGNFLSVARLDDPASLSRIAPFFDCRG